MKEEELQSNVDPFRVCIPPVRAHERIWNSLNDLNVGSVMLVGKGCTYVYVGASMDARHCPFSAV